MKVDADIERHVFTIQEAVLYARLSRSTLERLIAGKIIPVERHGLGRRRCGKRMIRKEHLDEYLDKSLRQESPKEESLRSPNPRMPLVWRK